MTSNAQELIAQTEAYVAERSKQRDHEVYELLKAWRDHIYKVLQESKEAIKRIDEVRYSHYVNILRLTPELAELDKAMDTVLRERK